MEKIFREVKEKIYFDIREDLDFPAHIHEDIELVFVKEGSGTAYCDGIKYDLPVHSFFIAFPNQVHHYSGCTPGQYVILIIKPSQLLGYHTIFSQQLPVSAVWHCENHEESKAVYLLEAAFQSFERVGCNTLTGSYLTALFGELLSCCPLEKCQVKNDIVSQILQYCGVHYKEDITISQVAKALYISRSSVSHIFSSRLSMHFCDYINSLRLADAARMLKTENTSISEIASLSGFSTPRTFNRAFQKRYGISPSAYRRS